MDGLACAAPQMNWESPDLESAWQRFTVHMNFVFNGPLKGKSEEEKCAYLMIWVGEKGRTIFETWNLTAEQSKVISSYTERFQAHVKPKTNIVYNRYKFQSKVQINDETLEQFVTDLQTLVKDCAYDKPEEMVRDRVVFGIKSNKIREKLICEGSTLTLEKTLDIARSYELAKKQSQTMNLHGGNSTSSAINAVKTDYKSKYKNECTRCGGKHGSKERCPAMGQKCKKCGKPDHFANKCRTKTVQKSKQRGKQNFKSHNVHTVNDGSDTEDEFYVGMVIELDPSTKYDINALREDFLMDAEVNKCHIKVQLDTGAKCNVMSKKTLEEINFKGPTQSSSAVLKSYSGHTLNTVGTVMLPLKIKSTVKNVTFHIVDKVVETILGADTCVKLNLIQKGSGINTIDKQDWQPSEDIFTGLGCLPGEHHINIDSNVVPVIHAPRKVPVALKEKVEKELKSMERQGVIIKQKSPTEWVNSMVTVIKPNGKLRICMDPKDLNTAIKREHHPLKTIEEILPQMSGAKVFTKLDATSGFWQCALDKESQKLCTFNSPYGRYSFTRLPYGIKSASEVYQKVVSDMLSDLDGCEAIIDDILIWGKDLEEHDQRLNAVLKRVAENNLKLNKDKCEFRKSSITYVGHLLSSDGLKPDPEKVRAVKEMQKPENTKELMTFLGFVNYLAKFIPNLSQKSTSLRKLLAKDISWHWETEQDEAFENLKEAVCSAPVLKYYDPKLPVTLSVDASSKGIGAVLLQDNQPVAYGSRALTSAQQNYAQIEKEALAISYGCTKFHQYVFGRSVTVESDHKPLQAIFRKQLHQAPPRLQRILLSLQKYDLTVQFKPGSEMYISDCLSRAYLDETKEDLNTEELSVNLLTYLPVSSEKLKQFQVETQSDIELLKLKETVEHGWPETKDQVHTYLKPYWNFRDEISVTDGLLFKSHKLIVPKTMRLEMLNLIHEGHLGIVKCKSRARETLFWPGMASDVEQQVAKCEICAENQKKNQKEPLVKMEIPNRPWAKISVDIFHFKGNNYVLSVDRFSLWPEIAKLDDMSSENTIMYLKSQFSRYGIPEEVYTDNGPQFASRSFKNFFTSYGFVHTTSSPMYAQSNGYAERGVQTIKNLLKKAKDPYKSVMIYRDTVIECIGQSPAQLFLGRRLRTSLPTTSPLLKTAQSDAVEKRRKMQDEQKKYYDQRGTKQQPALTEGEEVVMDRNSSWEPATVVRTHESPRSYVVRNKKTGELYRRNRKHLRSTKAQFQEPEYGHEDLDPTCILENTGVVNDVPQSAAPSTPQATTTTTATTTCYTKSGRMIKTPSRYRDYVK